jgi:hypothetical protein
MKITRIVYYCRYTRHDDTLPQYSIAFETEEAARVAAKKLLQQGYWGTIERHHQAKQDYENDYGWFPYWPGDGNDAVTILDYF